MADRIALSPAGVSLIAVWFSSPRTSISTIIAYAAQHQFTRWNGKAGVQFPIVEA